jgi:acetoin utilization deacetylase AcuC-like enzyme
MATGLIYHDDFLKHDPGAGHPERSDRLRAIVRGLREAGLWDRVNHLPFQACGIDEIALVHDRRYIDRVRNACEASETHIDSPDSAISPASYQVALLAAGGLLAAADAVAASRVRNAFCAVRPPGHHAERARSMGFCLFNNIAIAAEHLIQRRGVKRVAIVDFDVHHGNGTQHIFEHRSDVLFVSLHEHPACLYPGTGYEQEIGAGPGRGFTLNLPLPSNSGDETYRHAFEARVLPALDQFAPEFLLASAGFDAAAGDPLAHMQVSSAGFHWIAQSLKAAAERLCAGKIVSTLEGGYDLQSLSAGVAAYLAVMLGE